MWKNFFVFSGFLFFLSSFILLMVLDKSFFISITIFDLCNFNFFFDFTSWVFYSMVAFVSMMVFFYSGFYMEGDSFSKKFNWVLFLFVLSMFLLVSSSNMFLLMMGWDGLGLSSFCLIFYFQNWKSFNSAMTTFLTNRLGDVGLILCIFWTMSSMSGIYISSLGFPFFVCILLIVGAFTKSAQVPFSSWLPLAMAAPTPVSSLVHSSTLVTAGLYLIIRFNSLISDFSFCVVFYVSIITVLLAGVSSLGEMDFKKIIALSTLSHIGLMFMFVSMKEFNSALMHMYMHALFKSLLFMVAGSLIHNSISSQDLRSVSLISMSLGESYPLVISLMSMFGAPFLSGFVSKEFFLMNVMGDLNSFMIFVWFLTAVSLTASYSFRIFSNLLIPSLCIFTNFSGMNSSFFLSSMMSVFMGCVMNDLIISKSLVWVSLYSLDSKLFLYFSLFSGLMMGLFSWIMKGFKSIFHMWGLANLVYSFHLPLTGVSSSLFWKIDLKGIFEFLIGLFKFNFSVFSRFSGFYLNSFDLLKFVLLFSSCLLIFVL